MLGQTFEHRRTEDMRHVEHHRVRSPAIDERLQLILQVFGLLPGQSRHRIRTAKPLPRYAVTSFAIGDLGFKLLLRNRDVALVLRGRGGANNHKGCGPKYRCTAHEAALSLMVTLSLGMRFDPVQFL